MGGTGDAALTRLSSSPDPVVRARALLVQDALELGPTRAAREHGVSPRTAGTWLGRYRSGGAGRLEGADAGRRRGRADLRHAVGTAALWMPTTKWSSRSVAAMLGVSQSFVARTWTDAQAGSDVTRRLAAATGPSPTPVGLLVTGGYCALAVRPGPRRPAAARASTRTQRRLRAVLAADLAREQVADVPDPVGAFWEGVRAACGAAAELVVITSAEAPVPAGATRVACTEGEWQALLPWLSGVPDDLLAPAAAELEAELRRWYQAGHQAGAALEPFAWVAHDAAPSARGGAAPNAFGTRRRAGPERVLADQIVATIREGVIDGRLVSGDTVTERDLAGRLRTTRGQIRAALRLLERDGLMTARIGHGAVVPVPTLADAIETYAARRALGALVVRAATRWTPTGRQAVLDVLAQLDECAERDDVELANRLDMTFQNTLAEASGLTRIAPMVALLSDQVLMFIAVIGIDYVFPVEPIVRRDREIVAAIDAGDGELAVQCWREKLDEALAYMGDQINSARHLTTAPDRR